MPEDFRIPRAGGGPSNFLLSEWPCWHLYSPDQVAGVVEAVQVHLQPLRDRYGRIGITSGHHWKAGCIPRTGAHAIPGTVDYKPIDSPLADVFAYGASYGRSTFGTLIFERDHAHRTAPGAQGRWGYVLLEPTEGEYMALEPFGPATGFPGGWGTASRPFRDPGRRGAPVGRPETAEEE